jgi:hypothetical protein
MKLISTVRPGIVRWPNGTRELVGGTIERVNGREWDGKPILVSEDYGLEQVEWTRASQAVALPSIAYVQGSKGATYEVTTFATGRKTCTCPGFTFRRTCKHV